MAATAKSLLTDYNLMIAGQPHEIVEVEMYLKSPTHPDPYVHGYSEQELSGVFYFHRMGASYRGGTYKGMDICFGGGAGSGIFHGVLVRSIVTPDGTLVSGPCCCVDYILAQVGTASVANLVSETLANNINAYQTDKSLHLVKRVVAHKATNVLATPRVGLWLTAAAGRADYVGALYRFVRKDTLRKSGWKGTAHTLVGAVYEDLADVKATTGAKQPAIDLVNAEFSIEHEHDLSVWIGKKALTGNELLKFLVAAVISAKRDAPPSKKTVKVTRS